MHDKYDTNNHSVFLLKYHLILVTKYRRKVITDEILEQATSILKRIAPEYGITLENANGTSDHIHFLIKAQPNTNLSKFINAYKSASSRLIKKEHPEVRQKLWKEHFWSRSYFLATYGNADTATIERYVDTQTEGQPESAKSTARIMNR